MSGVGTRLQIDDDYLSMPVEQLRGLPAPGAAPAPPAPQQQAPEPPDYLSMPREDLQKLPPPKPSEGLGWRSALTVGIRGLGDLADAIPDPLSPIRRLISPELERIEKSGTVFPGKLAGDAVFSATGIPEYIPQNAGERVQMAAGRGAVAGGTLGGPLGALIGLLGGGGGQTAAEITATPDRPEGSDRWSTLVGLLPALIAPGATAARSWASDRARARVTPDLRDAGVHPTIGQMLGGAFNRIEEGIGSVPWLGDFIRSGRRGALEEANRGPLDLRMGRVADALDQAGVPLPGGRRGLDPNTATGTGTVREAQDYLGRAYDALEPRLGITTDPTFLATDLPRINQRVAGLDPPQRAAFQRIYQTEFLDKMQQPGVLNGRQFRAIEERLGQLATDRTGSGIGADRDLGRVLNDFRDTMRDMQMRQNPQYADALRVLHGAYADFERLAGAAGRIGSDQGVWTPSQLMGAVRGQDPSLNYRRFRTGQARLQEYAQHAKDVLGDKVPDSGTAFRSFLTTGAPFGVGLGLLADPTLGAAMGATAWGLGRQYSPRGRAALSDLLLNDPTGLPPFFGGWQSGQDPYETGMRYPVPARR